MPEACFICGAGVGAGKSVICAGLLQHIAGGCVVKIIQTGGGRPDQRLCAVDRRPRVEVLRHFCLVAPPHTAASEENQRLVVGLLAQEIRNKACKAKLTLLEGTDGVLTPLSTSETFLDLMIALNYPAILVVSNGYGAVNQALLSLEALRKADLEILGLIFTHPNPGYRENHPVSIENIRAVEKFGRVDVLGVVPYIPGLLRNGGTEAACVEAGSALRRAAGRLAEVKRDDGPPTEDVVTFDQRHLWHPYSLAPGFCGPSRPVEKTEGNYIYLQNGQKLLDGMSSWWCAAHGYGRPELFAALRMQAKKMAHVMFGGLTHEPAVMLGRSLLSMLPQGLDKIFFADSGSVAVEVALKMAVQYWQGRGSTKKTKIISYYGGYHGDTLGAMSVSDPVNGMHAIFSGFLPKQIFVPRPAAPFHAPFDESSLLNVEEQAAKHHRHCAAVIIEPIVQGAGGMWFYHPEYLKGLQNICRRRGLLLIFDEIATGFGRTGKMFASEWAGVSPDILCLGKALTGGVMTLAAAVCTEEVAAGISAEKRPLMHGPTFMANPLACRAAQAGLELLRTSNWAEQVRSLQNFLKKGLACCEKQAQVHDVRVLGAIGVVEMKKPVNVPGIQKYFIEEHGVWIRPFNRLIYVMPPYTTTEDECARLCRAVGKAVEEEKWL